jgi:uncharacterized protein (DUF1778 family)
MSAIRADRIDLRINPENKSLIAKAADLLGLNLTAFAVSTLVAEAQKVVDKHATIEMCDEDRATFLRLMDNPPAPNEALRRAAARHRELVGE